MIALSIAAGVAHVIPCGSKQETVMQFVFVAIGTFMMTLGFTIH
ncbi:hypothetical protein [Stenotrophomonas phage RAS14]